MLSSSTPGQKKVQVAPAAHVIEHPVFSVQIPAHAPASQVTEQFVDESPRPHPQEPSGQVTSQEGLQVMVDVPASLNRESKFSWQAPMHGTSRRPPTDHQHLEAKRTSCERS